MFKVKTYFEDKLRYFQAECSIVPQGAYKKWHKSAKTDYQCRQKTHIVVTVKFFVMIDPPQFRFDSIILSFGDVNNKIQGNIMEYQACDVFICWKGRTLYWTWKGCYGRAEVRQNTPTQSSQAILQNKS